MTTLENNFTTPNKFATARCIQTRQFYSEACAPGETHKGSWVRMFIVARFITQRRKKRETPQMSLKRITNN